MTGFHPTRILVSGDRVAGLVDFLGHRRPDLEFGLRRTASIQADDLEWADAYVGFRRPPPVGWGNVRWVHSIGAGVDGILRAGPLPASIVLTRSPEDFGPAIAEWCLCRALAENQRLVELAGRQRLHTWGLDGGDNDPRLIRGQRALILGTGLVGRGIARLFRAAGCRVDGLSRRGAPVSDFDLVRPIEDFTRVMAGADWLILALPLTPETEGLLTRERLSQCGGAYLMNVGRGLVVDEAALPDALDRGWIRGAALDVFAVEPLPADSPLWDHPRVVISPHNSGPSSVAATGDGFLECLAALERGERPRWAVDPSQGY